MISTLTRPRAHRTPTARRSPPSSTLAELHEAADRLGQMDLGDPRWPEMRPVLDACLLAAVADHDGPRASVWWAIATDAHAPLVVKLRTLASLSRPSG